jgi:hypothetical protein
MDRLASSRAVRAGTDPFWRRSSFYLWLMCRNITTLRGLEPPATSDEIRAAALQYVRKVSGVQTVTPRTTDAIDRAVELVASATAELLTDLPPRQNPPATSPPLRRLAQRSRQPG